MDTHILAEILAFCWLAILFTPLVFLCLVTIIDEIFDL